MTSPTIRVASPGTAPPAPTALQHILRTPFYRSAWLSMFIAGMGISFTAPQLTLYLVGELGASYTVAGLFYLTNLAAPVAGFLIGSWSDRQENRLGLFRICAVIGALGWLAMALATQVWVPFVVSAVALSIAGAAGAQLFAAARDELTRRPTPYDNRVISTLRMGWTGGWVVGPVLGSWFGAQFGLRALLFAAAVCAFGQIVPLGRIRISRYVPAAHRSDLDDTDGIEVDPIAPAARSFRAMVPLLVFTALCVLSMSGDTIKFAYLPLFMSRDLGVPAATMGLVIAVQPLLEFAMMPLAARLADRFGPFPMVVVGVLFAVGANLAYATSDNVAGLFVGQLLMSVTWATLGALGVTVAQELYPQGVGTASGTFMSSIMLSSAVGGLVGGLGVAGLGLPHVFFLPAGSAAVSAVGLIILGRRLHLAAVATAS